MNIFVLSENPRLAAKMHCDQHVNKMLTETAQMLSTVIWPHVVTPFEAHGWNSPSRALRQVARELYRDRMGLFLPTHSNHPCTLWTGKTRGNFEWLCRLGEGLIDEYSHRRARTHGSAKIITKASSFAHLIPEGEMTPFVQAFKTEYEHLIDPSDPVGAYREFYRRDKTFARYEWGRPAPGWFRK